MEIKPLSQLAQTDISISEGLGRMKYLLSMTFIFTHPSSCLHRKCTQQETQLPKQSERAFCSSLLSPARPHHLPPTASTSCSQTPPQHSAQKYIIKHGIKWEQPQTCPRKPGIKLILELPVPPAIIPTPSQITV